ncbi:amidohydrolase family protein [Sorangium sp. So ce367]|uniref:amidohydrolase family protein n=1 Tax=Sorangium sp. So ce367 TaxID=3133305 RepID=UPI003F6170FB
MLASRGRLVSSADIAALMLVLLLQSACAHGPAAPCAAPSRPADIGALRLADWQPVPLLALDRTAITHLAVPAVDVHTHLHRVVDVAAEVARMDAFHVETLVNLDGSSGKRLVRELERFDRAYPGRFLTYANLDLTLVGAPGWGERVAAQLATDFEAGAKGLKIFKELGLTVRTPEGRRVALDSPELEPVWRTCARHRRPVLWHVADPAAFFAPLDAKNERWHELHEFPSWSFADRTRFPTRARLFEERNRVIERHPDVTFVGAHMASSSEDLKQLAGWLARFPNLQVDMSASISELGRQPRAAHRFFVRYQDRVLFGTDLKSAKTAGYEVYARFLETEDDYFDTEAANGRQGSWRIYGMHLPAPVLQKIYRDNARRLLWPADPDRLAAHP